MLQRLVRPLGLGLLALAASAQTAIQHPAFTAIVVDVVYGRASWAPHIQHNVTTIAVRGDGANVWETVSPVPSRIRHIYLAGTHLDVNDDVKMVSSFYSVPVRNFADPRKDCLEGEDNFTNETIPGPLGPIETIKAVRREAGRINTAWYAPRFGCLAVKQDSVVDRVSRDDQQLVGLVMGEPDPKYFALPDNYQEVAPSVKARAALAYLESATGRQCPNCNPASMDEDAAYLRYGPASRKK